MKPITLDVSDSPSAEAQQLILDGLRAFNEGEVGASGHQPLAVLLRGGDASDEVLGGLSGYTAWGWLFIEKLWVPEALRGQGFGGKLLEAAEREAMKRGCHGAWLDTFNPDALALYQRHGYAVFGELPEFPKGRSRFFLKKSLG